MNIEEIVRKTKHCNSSLKKFKPISFAELKNTVKKLKKKNSSVDGITTNILQKAFEVIGDEFLQLVNFSLDISKTLEKNNYYLNTKES